MLAFPNVFHFLPDEFTGLSGGRLAFLCVFTRPFERLLFRHNNLLRSFLARLIPLAVPIIWAGATTSPCTNAPMSRRFQNARLCVNKLQGGWIAFAHCCLVAVTTPAQQQGSR
jgi:hypothetical protein